MKRTLHEVIGQGEAMEEPGSEGYDQNILLAQTVLGIVPGIQLVLSKCLLTRMSHERREKL